MNILFLTKYGQLGGSSRHMVYSYTEFYEQAGIKCTISPLFDDYYFTFRRLERVVSFRELASHAMYFTRRIIERLRQLFERDRYDLIVIEKEILPYVPFGLERLLQGRHVRIFSLYDDAVHENYARHPSPLIRVLCRDKIRRVIQASDYVVVWNNSLAQYARQHNDHVLVVNTGIDIRRYVPRIHEVGDTSKKVVIGWIGTPNSFVYLDELEPVFRELSRRFSVELQVVSSIDYQSQSIAVDNRRWSLDTEVDNLRSFDIGIAPLHDDRWTRGKSGYKAVQYMGVAVPAVCSPVGVLTEMIRPGINGYLATDCAEWIEYLSRLIAQPELRRRQGEAGRALAETVYSVQAVAPRLIATLKGAVV